MAVYTEVSFAQADAFVQGLGRGALRSLQGIGAGIENTNYFVGTDRGEWVLTLFERLSHEQLPFYLRYMQHLARHGLPVPEPQADAQGRLLHELCGRPAALLSRLHGEHVLAPDIEHIEQLGTMLARLHLAGADFELRQPHLRGAWTGGSPPCPRCCRSWTPSVPRCCATNWPFNATWPPPARRGRCRADRSMPTCSATTSSSKTSMAAAG